MSSSKCSAVCLLMWLIGFNDCKLIFFHIIYVVSMRCNLAEMRLWSDMEWNKLHEYDLYRENKQTNKSLMMLSD